MMSNAPKPASNSDFYRKRLQEKSIQNGAIEGVSLKNLLLYPEDRTLKNLPLEVQIQGRANALYLERNSHRDVVERLVAEGYPRDMVLPIIRKNARQWTWPSHISSPILFAIFGIILIMFGQIPNNEYTLEQVRSLKIMIQVFGLAITLPAIYATLYHTYDKIPVIGRFFKRDQTRLSTELVTLRNSYLQGEISDADLEAALVNEYGDEKGKRQFRAVRNEKHFGLD